MKYFDPSLTTKGEGLLHLKSPELTPKHEGMGSN